eukprot:TRINITY_DN2499_c0_g1_i1.p1 TRINITY_DN2499_c0_g1~~TRINITY_DN2499_c0_g1_i1.p1  ORF type:complete len:221 (+),score=30.87 TRINITY_DN2499_c0_g1_i1:202-864(+)
MGSFFSRIFAMFGNREVRVLILGLDNAGKTTILYKLQVGEVVSTMPTIGFNVETIRYNNVKFQVWDLGGQTSIRPYWRCYYSNTDAIIYVVDSADRERIGIAREELIAMLEEQELANTILLVLANKQDMPNAMGPLEITERLGLTHLRNRVWHIAGTNAITGDGLCEGMLCVSSLHVRVYSCACTAYVRCVFVSCGRWHEVEVEVWTQLLMWAWSAHLAA